MKKLMKQKERHQTKKKGLKIFLGIIIFLLLMYLLLIIIQVPYTANLGYNEKEPNKICNERDYNFEVYEKGDNCYFYSPDNWRAVEPPKNNIVLFNGLGYFDGKGSCTIKIFNNEAQAGNFEVKVAYYIIDNDNHQSILIKSKTWNNYNIGPNQNTELIFSPEYFKDFSEAYNRNSIVVFMEINTSKIEDCDTIYTDVEKTKEVTRYCSALKKLFGKC